MPYSRSHYTHSHPHSKDYVAGCEGCKKHQRDYYAAHTSEKRKWRRKYDSTHREQKPQMVMNVKRVAAAFYEVRSGEHTYEVDLAGPSCTCPGWTWKQCFCKHLKAVARKKQP